MSMPFGVGSILMCVDATPNPGKEMPLVEGDLYISAAVPPFIALKYQRDPKLSYVRVRGEDGLIGPRGVITTWDARRFVKVGSLR